MLNDRCNYAIKNAIFHLLSLLGRKKWIKQNKYLLSMAEI